jgi:hypothetical protein
MMKDLLLYLVLGFGAVACAEQPDTDMQGSAGTAGSTNSPLAGTSGNGSPTTAKFSYFLISYEAILALSGSAQGFGGDLRYGESGAGAGLRGADKICGEVAEMGMPGNRKTWRAFLSTSTGDAIDRIGEGPWYDRLGRVVALKKAELLATRPTTADIAIKYDLPNEYGVPNRAPDGTLVDNHDILTGSGIEGRLYGPDSTCSDWTSSARDTSKRPRVGHSWPRGNVPPGNVEGMAHWISALDESGCGAGVNLNDNGNPGTDGNVGSGGGYGGFYCFALTP